jgi:hypothetical protein
LVIFALLALPETASPDSFFPSRSARPKPVQKGARNEIPIVPMSFRPKTIRIGVQTSACSLASGVEATLRNVGSVNAFCGLRFVAHLGYRVGSLPLKRTY